MEAHHKKKKKKKCRSNSSTKKKIIRRWEKFRLSKKFYDPAAWCFAVIVVLDKSERDMWEKKEKNWINGEINITVSFNFQHIWNQLLCVYAPPSLPNWIWIEIFHSAIQRIRIHTFYHHYAFFSTFFFLFFSFSALSFL